MQNKLIALIITLGFTTGAKAQYLNELTLVISPLKFEEQSSYQMLYRRELSNENLHLRAGLRLYANTDKQQRLDTLYTNTGTVQYDFAIGLQRDLSFGDFETLKLYVAGDAYLNSDLRKLKNYDYYRYYWNLGVMPIVGIGYEPVDRIRLSVESRANLNFNMQDYSGEGENYDRKVSFRPLDKLAIGIGYLF